MSVYCQVNLDDRDVIWIRDISREAPGGSSWHRLGSRPRSPKARPLWGWEDPESSIYIGIHTHIVFSRTCLKLDRDWNYLDAPASMWLRPSPRPGMAALQLRALESNAQTEAKLTLTKPYLMPRSRDSGSDPKVGPKLEFPLQSMFTP